MHSPVSSAFSLPKWRRHFFISFLFFFSIFSVLHCKQSHPEQSPRVLTHLMWLAGVEDMLSQRSRCEDSSCRRRQTNMSCLKQCRSVRLPTARGGPAFRRGLLPSHSRRRSSLPAFIASLLKDGESVKDWKLESCKCTLTSCQTLKKSLTHSSDLQKEAATPSSKSSVCFVSWKCFLISAVTLKRLFTADRSTYTPSCFMDPEIVQFVSRVSVSVAAPCRWETTASAVCLSIFSPFLLHFLLQCPGVNMQVRASACLQLCKCTNVFKRLSWNQPEVNCGLGALLLVKVRLTEWITLIFLTFPPACLQKRRGF